MAQDVCLAYISVGSLTLQIWCIHTNTYTCTYTEKRQFLSQENLSTSVSSAFPGCNIKDFGGQCAGFCEHIYECLYLPNFHGEFSYLNSTLWILHLSKKSVLRAWQYKVSQQLILSWHLIQDLHKVIEWGLLSCFRSLSAQPLVGHKLFYWVMTPFSGIGISVSNYIYVFYLRIMQFE